MNNLLKEKAMSFDQKNHKSETLKSLFLQYYRPLCSFANEILNDYPTSKDLVNDAFAQLLDSDSIDDIESYKLLLFNQTREACLDLLNERAMFAKEKGELEYLAEKKVKDIECLIIEANLMEIIYQEIEKLPSERKKIFKLLYLKGLSSTDVANRLGLRRQTVLNQKSRAITALRSALIKLGAFL